MSSATDLARKHWHALLEETGADGLAPDAIGRAMLNQVVATWLEDRAWTDVADELRFTADSIDPDQDFVFMRP